LPGVGKEPRVEWSMGVERVATALVATACVVHGPDRAAGELAVACGGGSTAYLASPQASMMMSVDSGDADRRCVIRVLAVGAEEVTVAIELVEAKRLRRISTGEIEVSIRLGETVESPLSLPVVVTFGDVPGVAWLSDDGAILEVTSLRAERSLVALDRQHYLSVDGVSTPDSPLLNVGCWRGQGWRAQEVWRADVGLGETVACGVNVTPEEHP
jgi:hypothetical protein